MRRRVVRSTEGKTLEVGVELGEDGRISKVIIAGDFMAFPKEAVDELERSLIGRSAEEVQRVVMEHLEGVKIMGVTVEEIAEAIRELASSPSSSSRPRS